MEREGPRCCALLGHVRWHVGFVPFFMRSGGVYLLRLLTLPEHPFHPEPFLSDVTSRLLSSVETPYNWPLFHPDS